MPDTTARIAARGTNTTGITEALAEKLHDQLGKTLVAIVEITSDDRTEKADGKQKVTLKLGMIEPAPTSETEDHLRELARSFHYERKLAQNDDVPLPQPGDDVEPKVADVLAAGRAREPHDYVEDSVDEGECETCGQEPDAWIHHVPDDQPTEPDEDEAA